MRQPKVPKPTEAELQILRTLWELGPATVRQIHDALPSDRSVGYTTVLKMLQIMTEKGLVFRDEKQRSHVYRSAIGEEQTQRQLLRDLLDRAFGGSTQKLVMQALTTKKTSPDELAQIRKLLNEMEEKP